VSFLFGARPPRGDKELAEANERTRRAFARDINDQKALDLDPLRGVSAGRRRRSGMWMVWVVIAFLVAGAAGVLPSIGGVHIDANCNQPDIALSGYSVPAGTVLQWKTTGPDGVDYILAIDATEVTGTPQGAVSVDSGTAITPKPYRSLNCVGAGVGFPAPGKVGQHFVRLFKYADGRYVQVSQVPLAVK
jgi:hypothetical protein